ncbi:MAG: hypothetical protein Q8O29_10220 [Polaromonas sp.]|uniref:hypothetical protein n=1 Tax=Polaromonas sp. TaxID=1869339 RepID=UPI0027330566|nr:hypothetical protein [Polaromonas sp.]MDP2818629.1 hypothetical protein [Polaromonas sp.]
MMVRFYSDPDGPDQYGCRVSYEDEALYSDAGCLGIEACIVAATEGLGQDAVAAEVAYKGVISGTYALASLALAQIADHALQTSTAMKEVFKSAAPPCATAGWGLVPLSGLAIATTLAEQKNRLEILEIKVDSVDTF